MMKYTAAFAGRQGSRACHRLPAAVVGLAEGRWRMSEESLPESRAAHAGLTSAEVERSRREHGSNELTPPRRAPWWKLYLEKFHDPVIRILIIAAVIAIGVGAVDGHYVEGVGILCAIFLATTLAFLNEYRAGREFDILNKVSDEVPVKVIREGRYVGVSRRDLVVGDVVLVEQGEEIPADGELVESVSLQVDESRLTGESIAANKRVLKQGDPPSGADSPYPRNMVLRGTIVADGHGTMRVTSVGDRTEIGKTAQAAAEEVTEPTPLARQLERLSKVIGVFGFGVAGLLFIALVTRGVLKGEFQLSAPHWVFLGILFVSVPIVILHAWLPTALDALQLIHGNLRRPAWLEKPGLRGWLWTIMLGMGVLVAAGGAAIGLGWIGRSPSEWLPHHAVAELLTYFMVAVTLIVVAVPEGLAMSVTLSLAYSMRKMTASNNLVRRMHACETIGAANVICSDKTGTLTLNEMRVHAAHFPALDRTGDAVARGLTGKAGELIAEAVAANSTANVSREPNQPSRSLGNPTEGAMLLWLEERSVDYLPLRHGFPVDRQWTFTTERKYMATLGTSPATSKRILHVKGAPEIVMSGCSHLLDADGPQPFEPHRAAIESELRGYQERGMRTVAVAYREVADGEAERLDGDRITHDLVWLGFVAIHDPVRPDVPAAVAACRQAGMMVKLVTGDNPQTAQEIARQIDLWEKTDPPAQHVTGVDFDRLSEQEALGRVKDLKILSRARPMNKLRLVRLLQANDCVVAVTGDGTNDAPALNCANVGLAMGRSGTAVAREASDFILLDDSFRSIVNAVMWGRSLYENIQRFILFQLTINVAALATAFLGPFLGVKLPLTVVQMLWVNLIMDTFAALALAGEPAHPHVMNRPPRRREDFILTRPMAVSLFATAGVFIVLMAGGLVVLQRLDLQPGFVLNRASSPAERAAVSPYELTVFFTCFVMLQFWNLFNVRCLGRNGSAFSGLAGNRGFVVMGTAILLGQFLIVQFGGGVFRTVPLSPRDWAIIFAATSAVLWCGEAKRLMASRVPGGRLLLGPKGWSIGGLLVAMAFALAWITHVPQDRGSVTPEPRFAPPPAGPIQLRDVTERAGITFTHTDGSSGQRYIVETVTAGLALFDYDGDGYVDIYFLNGAPLRGSRADVPPRNALYRNEGNWKFTDVTAEAGVGDTGFALGVAAADYDNDGDQDLFVNNYGPNVLYRNNGDGTFTDVTEEAGVSGGDKVGAGACFLDFDADGDLDLYVANYVKFTYDTHVVHVIDGVPQYVGPRDYPAEPDLLYRNNGDGTFTDVSMESGVGQHAGSGMGIVCGDYDNDGDTDVFVLNDVAGNFLFQNDGSGRFDEVGVMTGAAYNGAAHELGSMGVDCGDYNNDGRLDFLMTSYQGELPVLYRNLGGDILEDATMQSGAGDGAFPYVNWGTGLVDFDNDGDRDIFIACGHLQDNIELVDDTSAYHVRNILLQNTGDGRFVNVSKVSGDGLLPEWSSRGAAFDDLDNDGDIDVVIQNSRRGPTILSNESQTANHWLQIRLRGVSSNRDGVGARVTVVAGDLTQVDEVHSGRGYQSHWGSRLHFGLGKRSRVDRVEVRWIGGAADVIENVDVDRLVTITEGTGKAEPARRDIR